MERPHDYLKVVVAVLPREISLGFSTQQRRVEELSDEELTAIIRDHPASCGTVRAVRYSTCRVSLTIGHCAVCDVRNPT